MSPCHQYEVVSGADCEDVELCPVVEKSPSSRQTGARSVSVLSVIPWIIAATAVSLLALNQTRWPTPELCFASTSVWSPAMAAVEYQDVQFQNQFGQKSIYKGRPTPALEVAWLRLWNFGPVNVPMEKLPALNKSSDANWQRAKADKGGGVLGSLEVFHQIHCLDLIRQYTYRDDYDYSRLPAFDGSPKQVRHHVDHCIDSLRIHLQCAADVTPYLILKDPNRPLGIDTDFNTQHKCRNFDKIQQWASKHQLNTQDYQDDIHQTSIGNKN